MPREPAAGGGRRRRPRWDAEANRERLLAAAVTVMLREGRHVPLRTIAEEAGVGIATFYRKYADRDALMQALEHRAYDLLVGVLEEIAARPRSGREAIGEYLTRCLAMADQLVLPLHGAPPLVTDEAVNARRTIYRHLDAFLARGRSDGSVRGAANATDVIVFTSLLTQPLAHGPDWPLAARRQLALFLNALAAEGPTALPGPAIEHADIEAAFARHGLTSK
ncbi:TetR/AcrR family transcriptional regulator [Spongiactinospora rosea]|uniref:TetR/AcrR family transcriptional regulator n=1 Tax=Spongiactinospora rosea TaxID=2248750 RepID=UPI001314673B|nr:TetR/AcrR family transcriptional regulator [Spongiactinospora rosea]